MLNCLKTASKIVTFIIRIFILPIIYLHNYNGNGSFDCCLCLWWCVGAAEILKLNICFGMWAVWDESWKLIVTDYVQQQLCLNCLNQVLNFHNGLKNCHIINDIFHFAHYAYQLNYNGIDSFDQGRVFFAILMIFWLQLVMLLTFLDVYHFPQNKDAFMYTKSYWLLQTSQDKDSKD